jgi:hypothetical protein
MEARAEAALATAGNPPSQLNSMNSQNDPQESRLLWNSETVSVTMSILCMLSANQWVGQHIFAHAALAESLDSVLEEETYLQVRSASFFTKSGDHSQKQLFHSCLQDFIKANVFAAYYATCRLRQCQAASALLGEGSLGLKYLILRALTTMAIYCLYPIKTCKLVLWSW